MWYKVKCMDEKCGMEQSPINIETKMAMSILAKQIQVNLFFTSHFSVNKYQYLKKSHINKKQNLKSPLGDEIIASKFLGNDNACIF